MPRIPFKQTPRTTLTRGPCDQDTLPLLGKAKQRAAAQRGNLHAETASPHQRQSDRGSDDADAAPAPLLPTYVRFNDLVQANIVSSWTQLNRLVNDQGFPPGTMIGPNSRAWRLSEVEAWLASRPTGRKPVPDAMRFGYRGPRGKRAKPDTAEAR